MPPNAPRGSHFDLMLEHRDKLLTWAFPSLKFGRLPSSLATLGIQRLPDHRLAYLTFEGPISQDRGFVTQVDFGTYSLTANSGGTLQLEGQVLVDAMHIICRGRRFAMELALPCSLFSSAPQALEQGHPGCLLTLTELDGL